MGPKVTGGHGSIEGQTAQDRRGVGGGHSCGPGTAGSKEVLTPSGQHEAVGGRASEPRVWSFE